MRISELARETGVPVATVKYYLREGLVPPGERHEVNQARYDERHVRRLRLVRALIGVAGLSIAQVREVVAAVDDPDLALHDLLGEVQNAVAGSGPTEPDGRIVSARAEVDAFLAGLGWKLRPDAPTRDRLATVVASIRSMTGDEDPLDQLFGEHAGIASKLATLEIGWMPGSEAGRDELAESVVIGVSLFGEAFAALRLLAEEDASARRYGTG